MFKTFQDNVHFMCFEIETLNLNIINAKAMLNNSFIKINMEYDLVPYAYVLCLCFS